MHGEFVPECEGTILFIGDPALDQGGIKGVWRLDGDGKDDDISETMLLDATDSGHIFGRNIVTEASENTRFQITGHFTDIENTEAVLHQRISNGVDEEAMQLELEFDPHSKNWKGCWREHGEEASGHFKLSRCSADSHAQWTLHCELTARETKLDENTRWEMIEVLKTDLLHTDLIHAISTLQTLLIQSIPDTEQRLLSEDAELYSILVGVNLPPLLYHVDETVVVRVLDLICATSRRMLPSARDLRELVEGLRGAAAQKHCFHGIAKRLLELLAWPSQSLAHKALEAIVALCYDAYERPDPEAYDYFQALAESLPNTGRIFAAMHHQANRRGDDPEASLATIQFLNAIVGDSATPSPEDDDGQQTSNRAVEGLELLMRSREESCWEPLTVAPPDPGADALRGRLVYLREYGEAVVRSQAEGTRSLQVVPIVSGRQRGRSQVFEVDVEIDGVLLEPQPYHVQHSSEAAPSARFMPQNSPAMNERTTSRRTPFIHVPDAEWSHKEVCEWLHGHSNPVCRLYAGRIWWPHPDSELMVTERRASGKRQRAAAIDVLEDALGDGEHAETIMAEIRQMRGFLRRYKLCPAPATAFRAQLSQGRACRLVFARDCQNRKGEHARGELVLLKSFENPDHFVSELTMRRHVWVTQPNAPLGWNDTMGKAIRVHVVGYGEEQERVRLRLAEMPCPDRETRTLSDEYLGDDHPAAHDDASTFDERLCGHYIMVLRADAQQIRNQRLLDRILSAELADGAQLSVLPDTPRWPPLRRPAKADSTERAAPLKFKQLTQHEKDQEEEEEEEEHEHDRGREREQEQKEAVQEEDVQEPVVEPEPEPEPEPLVVASDPDVSVDMGQTSTPDSGSSDSDSDPEPEHQPQLSQQAEPEAQQRPEWALESEAKAQTKLTGSGKMAKQQRNRAAEQVDSLRNQQRVTFPDEAGDTLSLPEGVPPVPMPGARTPAEPVRSADSQLVQQVSTTAEEVLRARNIPEIYWPKIMAVFSSPGGMDERSWPIVLQQLDDRDGGILESVELRQGQKVKVYSDSKKAWSEDAHVKEVLADGSSVKVKYKVGGKSRESTKSIGDSGLRWEFRGALRELQSQLAENH